MDELLCLFGESPVLLEGQEHKGIEILCMVNVSFPFQCTPKSSTHWTNAINGGESKVKSLDGEQLICLLNAGLCYYESQRSYFDVFLLENNQKSKQMNHLTLDKVKVIHQYNRKAAGYIHECVAFRQNHDIQSESTDLCETFLKFVWNSIQR